MHEKPSPLSMRSFVCLSDFSYSILLKYFILFNFSSCLAALERSLLAMALTGKDRNWHANDKKISGGCTGLSPQMTIASNHIPTKYRPYLLLEDFSSCLILIVRLISQYLMFAKCFFSPAVVHALSSHFSSLCSRLSCFPGPYEVNRWLFRVCIVWIMPG